MSIQIVPVTAANEAEWKRQCAGIVNQINQKLADAQLTSLAALDYTGNAAKAIVVNATEDGFELVAGGGGGGTTTNALTINNSGTGAASGATFNGSAAVTISYNTVGAAASSHTHTQADVTGLTTADSPQFTAINLGHASDTTLTRVSAGVVAIEGVNVVTTAGGVTFTNDISVPAEAYGSGWNGSNEAPTKNDVYDKIEAVTGRQWALAGSGQTATGVWDFAVDGAKANVDFTGLAGYTEILLIALNVTKSITGLLNGTVSTDNGSTWYTTSGDFILVDANGATSNQSSFALHGTNATAARCGMVQIHGTNVAASARLCEQKNNPTLSRLFVASTSAINAVRLNGSGGGNLSGGKIFCFAR